jgi:hypothetical protein
MFTLSLLTSRSVRVFFDLNATKALPESAKVNDTRGSLKALAATVALAAASVVLAQSQTTQVAMNTQNPAPTLSVKGGWQVVNIGGVEYTFSKISGMSGEEQQELLKQIRNPIQKIQLWVFLNETANQEADQAAVRRQAANQKWEKLDIAILSKMEEVVAIWKPLKLTDKPYLEKLAKWSPPNLIAEKLLVIAKFV